MKKLLFIIFIFYNLYGCTNIGEPTSTSYTSSSYSPNAIEIVFLSDSEFNTEMLKHLSKNGFKVKPFVSQQQVTQKLDDNTKIKYNEASARYGIKIEGNYKGDFCVINNSRVYYFTIMLIDIAPNQIINIYEQKAAFPKKCIGAKQESIIVNYVNHLKSLNL